MRNLSRRMFLSASVGAAGMALAACAQNGGEATDAETAEPASDAPVADTATDTAAVEEPAALPIQSFDMHADSIDALGMVSHRPYADFDNKYSGELTSNNGQVSADRIGDIQWVQCYAIWLPDANGEGDNVTDLSHIDWYRKGVQWFKAQMDKHSDRFAQVRNFADIPSILEAGKIAAILTVENAACLNEGIQVVDEFAEDGVMIAGITWNGRNALGSGNTHPEMGLTDLGRQYIAALEEHNIVADVSHLNEKGFWELEEIATKPYIATHSNARAVCDHLRNLTDDQFAAIAARGGLVGLNFNDAFVREGGHAYTFDELAAHVDHWLEIGGEDVIALGTDRDGADIPTWLADCANQGYLFERFAERLGEDITRKIFFDNAMRFFEGLRG